MRAGQTERPKVERLGEPGSGAIKVTLSDGRVDLYRSASKRCEFELNGSPFHALAALVRLDIQGHVVATGAVKHRSN